MNNDSLGDRMKQYEKLTDVRLMPMLPVIARLDGKCFSKFTRGLEQPFDKRFSDLMISCTGIMAEQTNAIVGYTQSDEITLVWYSDNTKSQIFHDGRLLKMTSVLAAMLSVWFNKSLPVDLPDKAHLDPLFDCRVWTVPTLVEASNVLVWREQDAVKNSITMAAQEYYSHMELYKKTGSEKQEMLFSQGVNWNDYPAFFKRGTYVKRIATERKFTATEIDKLPAKHEARLNPELVVQRHSWQTMDWPRLTQIKNRVGVLFHGEEIQSEDVG